MSARPIKAVLTNSYFDELWTRSYSTKENALTKATSVMIQDCQPGCVVTVTDEHGNWLGTAKLLVGGHLDIVWKEGD